MAKSHYERELEDVVQKIVDELVKEAEAVRSELEKWRAVKEDSLEKLGRIAELKMRKIYIKKLLNNTRKIISKATNRLVIVAHEPSEN